MSEKKILNNDIVSVSTGKLGVGTTSPNEKLEVSGEGNVYAKITSTTTSGNAGVKFLSTNAREYGIFTDGNLRFYDFSASAERMRITQAGNVGIGTTSPETALHVIGDIGAGTTYNGGYYASADASNVDQNWGFDFSKTSGVDDYSVRVKFYPDAGTTRKVGFYDSRNNTWMSYFDGSVDSSPNFIISTGGNTGIGTNDPSSKLDVLGNTRIGPDSEHAFQVTDDSTNNFLVLSSTQRTTSSAARDIKFRSYGTDATDNVLVMDMSAGRVGIGTASPVTKLYVDGGESTFNRGNSDGAIARFRGSNAEQAVIGTVTSWFDSNVGIGTTSPSANLHVAASSDAHLLIESDNAMSFYQDSAWASQMLFGAYWDGTNQVYGATSRGAFKMVALHDADNSPQYFAIYGANQGTSGGTVTWNTVGFAQDEDGNVGIGTTSPGAKLDVNGVTRISGDFAGTGQDPLLEFYNTDTSLTANQILGTIDFYQSDSSGGGVGVVSRIRSINDSSFKGEASLTFHTGEAGVSFAERMRIDSSGNVGIGTASPLSKIHSKGELRVDFNNTDGSTYITGYGVEFERGTNYLRPRGADGTQTLHLGSAGDGLDWNNINFKTSSHSQFRVAGSDVMRINSTGVGIGTTNPGAKLDITTDHTSQIPIRVTHNNYNDWLIQKRRSDDTQKLGIKEVNSNGGMGFATADAVRMIIDSSGNVGIGATAPLRKLHVVGNFAVNAGTGQYYGVNITGGEGTNPTILIGDWHNASANLSWDSTNRLLRIDAQYSTSGAPIVFSGNDAAIEYARFTSSGNLGIGTSAPGGKLTVSGSATGLFTNLLLSNTNDTDGDATGIGFSMLNNMTYVKGGIFYERTDSGGRGSIHIATTNTTDSTSVGLSDARLTVDKAGNVGIGTASPAEKLEVSSSGNVYAKVTTTTTGGSNAGIKFLSSGAREWGIFTDGNLRFYDFSASSERIRIDTSGNVGIGTTAPSAKLDIYGDSNSADNMIELINSKYDSTNTAGETGILFGWNNHVAARIAAFKEGTVNRTGFKIVGEAGFNVATTIATFRSTGRVGIGTTSPSYTFTVSKSVSDDWLAQIVNTATGNANGLL